MDSPRMIQTIRHRAKAGKRIALTEAVNLRSETLQHPPRQSLSISFSRISLESPSGKSFGTHPNDIGMLHTKIVIPGKAEKLCQSGHG